MKFELSVDSDAMDWWIARNIVTGKEGYIPSNYVVVDDDRPESQELVIYSFMFNIVYNKC